MPRLNGGRSAEHAAEAAHRRAARGGARSRAGTYLEAGSGGIRVLELENDALTLQVFGMALDLLPLSETEFAATGVPVDLTLRFAPGEPGRMVETLEGERTEFARVETARPTRAELRAYTGRFYSPELDASYEVRLQGEALRLVPPGSGEPVGLAPLLRGSFHGDGMRLRFRAGGEQASGFLLDLGRVRGLVFERVAASHEPVKEK